MALRRCTCQLKPLRSFHAEFLSHDSEAHQNVPARMLDLLRLLEERLRDVEVWGLTSLASLSLRRQDDWEAPGYVFIHPGSGWIEVSYKIPTTEAPWEEAIATGRTDNAEDAARMVLIAMVRSGAWPEIRPAEKLPRPVTSF